MNKKLRNLRKRIRTSKNSSQNIAASLNRLIELHKAEIKDLRSKLLVADRDLRKVESDHNSALSGYKELECFRVAVNNSYPFRSSGPCDIFNIQMQVDMRSFEFGMFSASRNRLTPMCKILDYVRHDLSRVMIRQIEVYLKEKGINVQY